LYEEAIREITATMETHNLIYEFLNSIVHDDGEREYAKNYENIKELLKKVFSLYRLSKSLN